VLNKREKTRKRKRKLFKKLRTLEKKEERAFGKKEFSTNSEKEVR